MRQLSWSDETVDRLIGTILQAGVIASGALVFIGGLLYLLHTGLAPANYGTFQANRAAIKSLGPVLAAAAHLDGWAIIQLGIVVLISTPVIRVMFSVVAFGIQRDRLYVPITLIVLVILMYGLFGTGR